MNEILISIIVPVYNTENFLSKCLESLINQTYKNIEIICVNDGSTDNSSQILESFLSKDSRITIINQDNRGISQSRNEALKNASGDYIMFVDSDDWIEEKTCEFVVKEIESHEYDVVMWAYVSEGATRSDLKFVFNEKKIFKDELSLQKIHRRFIGIIEEELRNPELADSLCPVWGKIYRRKLLNNLEFVDLKKIGTYEDGLFNLEVFWSVKKAVYLHQPLYHYRRNNNNSHTAKYRPNLFTQWNSLFNIMQRFIARNRCGNDYYDALSNRIALSILGLGLNILNSKFNFLDKCRMIKDILTKERYLKAYKSLKFKYFPLHWKLFYFCAKHKLSFGLYVLLNIIKRIKT